MSPLKKTCRQCQKAKPVTDFFSAGRRKDGTVIPRQKCKVCYNLVKIKRLKKIRAWLYDIKKEMHCNICGYSQETHENFKTNALEFHHINDDKSFTIGDALSQGLGKETILKEIEKCVVLCARCHAEIHSFDSN